MRQKKIVVFLRDNHQKIHGPYTLNTLEKLFKAPHNLVEWIFYEAHEDWSTIDVHKLHAMLQKPTSSQLKDKTIYFSQIQHLKTVCRVKDALWSVKLDHITSHHAIMFLDKLERTNSTFLPKELTITLNILDIDKNISENIEAKITNIDNKEYQYRIDWKEFPLIFKEIMHS
jgi:hypothetical protein